MESRWRSWSLFTRTADLVADPRRILCGTSGENGGSSKSECKSTTSLESSSFLSVLAEYADWLYFPFFLVGIGSRPASQSGRNPVFLFLKWSLSWSFFPLWLLSMVLIVRGWAGIVVSQTWVKHSEEKLGRVLRRSCRLRSDPTRLEAEQTRASGSRAESLKPLFLTLTFQPQPADRRRAYQDCELTRGDSRGGFEQERQGDADGPTYL